MTRTAQDLAADLIRHWEQFREFAYPDPASDLAMATPRERWGFEPAVAILERIPTSTAVLSGDPWTVGYGETGPSIGPATRWSLAVAEASLAARVEEFARGVRRLVRRPMTPWQEAALISFAWNVGLDEDADTVAEGLGDSTLLRLFNAGQDGAAAMHFGRWVYAGGRVKEGLKRRRIQERSMFLGTHPAIRR